MVGDIKFACLPMLPRTQQISEAEGSDVYASPRHTELRHIT